MTNPTYFARIGNEAEREMAHVLSSRHMRDDYEWEVIFVEHGQVFLSWHENMSKQSVELPFPDFIRRFVPLSVIGSLAACHGMSLFPKVTATNPPPNPPKHETTDAIGKWSLPCSICGLYTTRTSGICISCSQQL